MLASTNTNFLQMCETMDGQPQLTSDCSQPLYPSGFFVEPSPAPFPYWQDEQTGYFYPVVQDSPTCMYYPVMEHLEPTYGQLEHVSTHLEPIQSVQFQMPQLETSYGPVDLGQVDQFGIQYHEQYHMEPIQHQVELPVLTEQQEYEFENPEELYYGSISQYADQQGTQQWTEQQPPPQKIEAPVLNTKEDVSEQHSTVEVFTTFKPEDQASESKENEKPPGYKSRLCTHYASGRKCPKGPNCHFAHGPQELKNRVPPAPTDPRRKTMICRNLETCTLGIRCRFLHPEDGPAYLKAVDFEEKKAEHGRKVQALHTLKRQHPEGSQEALDVEDQINKTVREYNGTKPRGEHYYDLHGMTTNGAEVYVEEIVVEMQKSQVERAWFETGRGNHSKWNFPAIKRLLIDKYSGSNDICISCDQLNPGILVLTIL
ncbi:hypothetical protein B9Z55_008046 [Caenorhabditis nigoni]|uniref:Uncharacterized protein n=1 Tax=Caenorhabditis nigoni TaxID=1611254 RepID=A0A2G5VCC9_9PELO|nr:hypothetical protein B9Z55_008046 [Caenorhabditis nigoni]